MPEDLYEKQTDFYTVDQASKLLGVDAGTIRNWDKSGKIKLIRTNDDSHLVTKEHIDKIRQNPQSMPTQSIKTLGRSGLINTQNIQKDPRLDTPRALKEIKTQRGGRLLSLPKPISKLHNRDSRPRSNSGTRTPK